MLDLAVMCEVIDEKLGYDCGRVFYPDTGSFDDWHKANKLKVKDREGKHKDSSKIYYSWYQSDVTKGLWKETPYCDFWHWMLDNCFDKSFSNDSEQRLYLGDSVTCKQYWQRVIYKVWQDEYGHLCDEHGYIKVYVNW